MSKEIGRFVVIVFRGERERHYADHIRRISNEKDGICLLVGERDMRVFVRQALNGKTKEDHIQAIYDETVRSIA